MPLFLRRYGAADLNFTWLETLANILYEVLLLLRIPRIEAMAPYCLVCGDPTAPSLESSAAIASPPTRSVVPPAEAGKVPWGLSLRGLAHSVMFKQVATARAYPAGPQVLEELFLPGPASWSNGLGSQGNHTRRGLPVHASLGSLPQELVGWRVAFDEVGTAAFILHLGPNVTTFSVINWVIPASNEKYNATVWYPRNTSQLIDPTLRPADLASVTTNAVPVSTPLRIPPYSIATVAIYDVFD